MRLMQFLQQIIHNVNKNKNMLFKYINIMKAVNFVFKYLLEIVIQIISVTKMLNLFQSKYPTVNNKNYNKKREGIIITIKIN